ncbi:unnamed protein product [Linum trigynum]|uniref:RING-type E3 ubiquitin transferase n=1 Tax=Linum trigynum TaxID=586398 RepID=A0AAV2DR66_9ROSI
MAKNHSPFPFLLLKVSIFSFLLPLSSAYSSSILPSYTHHCSLTVPPSPPTEQEVTTIPFPPNQDGYYVGGDGISNLTSSSNSSSSYSYFDSGARKIFLFRTHHVHKTESPEVYKITADLVLETSGMRHYSDFTSFSYSYSPHVIVNGVQKGPLTFQMEGFWSPSSGKMCMVGFGDVLDGDDMEYGHGRGRGRFSGILKMMNVKGSSELTSLVTGTLQSDVGEAWSYEPVSMLLIPRINYEYKHVRGDGKSCGGGSGDVLPPSHDSLSLPLSTSICSPFFSSYYPLRLNYAKPCNVSSSSPAKNCNPLENHHGDSNHLARFVSLRPFQCSDEKQSLRFLMEFSNNSNIDYYHPFSPNTTLVSEGTWNAKNNRLCIVACRIRDATNVSFITSKIEDCSIRMSLSFPETWSMGNTSTMVGEIWSSLDAGDSGYFHPILVKDRGYKQRGLPGLKYEYTMVEKANASCSKVSKINGGKIKQFPNGGSDEMRFDMSFKDSVGRMKGGWGRAEPIFVGDQVPHWNLGGGVTIMSSDNDRAPAKFRPPSKPVNISYSIGYTPFNLNATSSENGFWVSAEGVYEAETGHLCMVGCKFASSSTSRYNMAEELDEDSKDCEVLIMVDFPSMDSNENIQGRIESTREKATDPLYFEPLVFIASSFYGQRARESVWRMDLEVTMALISNTLLCVFVCYQIFHVRRNPDVFPFLSFLMLTVLALGHLIPLVLNFDELFLRKQERRGRFYYWRSTGKLEADEVILRVVTMIVLILHLRLLQLTWLARQANKDKKASIRPAETKALLITLPLYFAGALIALGINWKHYEFGANSQGSHRVMHRSLGNQQQHSILTDLRSYAGLLLDGFLLPQILLNIFHGSTPQTPVLSRLFYVGTTLTRLVPHGYDLFRAQNFAEYFDWSYIYANPEADYYSTWSDVVIPLVCLMFAVIIYLQQRFGGRCFLPKKLRVVEGMYQKVAVTDDEEQLEEKSHVVGHLPSV